MTWSDDNQAALASALAQVRHALERFADGAGRPDEEPAPPAPDSALAAVCAVFALTPFERDVLLLCAGVELDGELATLCGTAHRDPARQWATFGLALAALPGAHWSALAPAAPLRHWRLVELDGQRVTRDPLRASERVLHHLAGIDYLDPALHGVIATLPTESPVAPSQAAQAERAGAHLEAAGPRARIALHGPDPGALRAVAAAACAASHRRPYVLAAGDVPAVPAERETLLRLWEREAALAPVALLVSGDDAEPGFLDRLAGPVLTVTRDPIPLGERPALRLEVARARTEEQDILWARSLAEHGVGTNGAVQRLTSQFQLDEPAIRQVVEEAVAGGEDGLADRLWEGCRAHARPRLEDLAQRLEPAASWTDLVLPLRQVDTLREIAAQVRQRTRVYEEWGFAAKSSRGLGIAALFTGASGTGKTMAGEVLARELRLDLYRIDLSAVVSKYIGETEKNLRRVFDAAEGTGAILLFDEADALFGKRTTVKDSHDRYANIEVSYLLQRVEAYRGLAILTTNLRSAIDSAFMRRIRFVVDFPLPDAAQRRAIWAGAFPSEAPVEKLDLDRLAQLAITGGSIRNISLNAAFLAADGDEPVGMRHLLCAVRSEYGKLGQPLSGLELGDWR